MAAKSLLVSFLSFILLFGVSFLLEGPDEIAREYPFEYFLQVLFYGGIPFVLIGFIVLLLYNIFIESWIKSKTKSQTEMLYWFFGAGASIVPTFGFVIFDYTQRGRYFNDPDFFDILLEYLPFLILTIAALFLNRLIVWNNFRK